MSSGLLKQRDRIIYLDPNNLPGYYASKNSNGTVTDNITWPQEDLNILVDLQVIVPSRIYDPSNVDKYFDYDEQKTNLQSIFSGTILKSGSKGTSLTDDYTSISYQEIKNNNAGSREMLGINSINISFDSNMYPRVKMNMTDVRGASLMMPQEQTYYDMHGNENIKQDKVCLNFFQSFFKFPYPRFLLSIKGIYGTCVTFDLAVEDFKATFNSETGNFDVNVSFIGLVYGFYTDIPMNYIILAPYINGKEEYNGLNEYWYSNTQNENGRFFYNELGNKGAFISTFYEFADKYRGINDTDADNRIEVTSFMASLAGLYNRSDALNALYSKVREFEGSIKSENFLYKFSCSDTKIVFFNLPLYIDINYIKEIASYFESAGIKYKKEENIDKDSEEENGKFVESIFTDLVYYEKEGKFSEQSIEIVISWEIFDINNINYSGLTSQEQNELKEALKIDNFKAEIQGFNYFFTYNNEFEEYLLEEIANNNSEIEIATENASDNLKEIFKESCGFSPTLENVLRMIFAHIDTFFHEIYGVLSDIHKNNEKRILSDSNFVLNYTDINSSFSNKTPLPPFTGFYKDNNKGNKERTFPGSALYNNKSWIRYIDEVLFVNDLFDKFTNIYETERQKAEERIKIVESGFEPICVTDCYYNDVNPYSYIKSYKDPYDIIYFIINRLSLAYQTGNYKVEFENLKKTDIWRTIIGDNRFKSITVNNIINSNAVKNKDYINELGTTSIYKNGIGIIPTNHIYYIFDGLNTIKDIPAYNAYDKKQMKELNFLTDTENLRKFSEKNVPFAKNSGIETNNGVVSGYNFLIPLYDGIPTILKIGIEYRDSAWYSNATVKNARHDLLDIKDKETYDSWAWTYETQKSNKININNDSEYYEINNIINNGTYSFWIPIILGKNGFESHEYKADEYYNIFFSKNYIRDIDRSEFWAFYMYSLVGDNVAIEEPTFDAYTSIEKEVYNPLYDDSLPLEIKAYWFLLCFINTIGYSFEGIDFEKEFLVKLYSSQILFLGGYIKAVDNDWFKKYGQKVDLQLNTGNIKIITNNIPEDIKTIFINRFNEWVGDENSTIERHFSNILKEIKIEAKMCSEDDYYKKYYIATHEDANEDTRANYRAEWFYRRQGIRPNTNLQKQLVDLALEKEWLLHVFPNGSYCVPEEDIKNLLSDLNAEINIEQEKKENYEKQRAEVSEEEKTSLYYTLKNLYDRWLSSYTFERFKLNSIEDEKLAKRNKINGVYDRKSSEFNNFLCVDSFYNNISKDFLINPSAFFNLLNEQFRGNTNYNLLDFLGKLCQDNKLMFRCVPLYNSVYGMDTFEEIFRPWSLYNNGADKINRKVGNTYMIMYPYEPSSKLNIPVDKENGVSYLDDSYSFASPNGEITDEATKLFSKKGEDDINVTAFGVSYGMQNQSYFTKISVGMDAPRVTDVSILNKMELANEGNTNGQIASKGTGQDLFSIYSNRSYDCTVEMLGCANIVPMMYFQLNNIPMFRGAYMITKVEHNIQNNTMITKFTGTRMSRYFIPYNKNVFNMALISKGVNAYRSKGDNSLITKGTVISRNVSLGAYDYGTPISETNSEPDGKGNWGSRTYNSTYIYQPEKPAEMSVKFNVWAAKNQMGQCLSTAPRNYIRPYTHGAKVDGLDNTGKCAKAVSMFIMAGFEGLLISNTKNQGAIIESFRDKISDAVKNYEAKDYFANEDEYGYDMRKKLAKLRFSCIAKGENDIDNYDLLPGDVCVMKHKDQGKNWMDSNGKEHTGYGHVCMWSGEHWVSDYKQAPFDGNEKKGWRTGWWRNRNGSKDDNGVLLYRYPFLITGTKVFCYPNDKWDEAHPSREGYTELSVSERTSENAENAILNLNILDADS